MVQVLAGSTLFQRISKKRTAVRWGAKAVSPCVIAVMGIGGSVGTTHLCMMLANSMANGLKVRTAFVEYGVHDTGSVCLHLAQETKSLSGDIHTFQYAGIDFYRCISEEELIKISAMKYEAVILDMKYGSKEVMTEFLRSDLKIVVAGHILRECCIISSDRIYKNHSFLDYYKFLLSQFQSYHLSDNIFLALILY